MVLSYTETISTIPITNFLLAACSAQVPLLEGARLTENRRVPFTMREAVCLSKGKVNKDVQLRMMRYCGVGIIP
ncbi:hypothetical protein BS47DRAFT_1128045 [Hydnum rufescens UP504]|uniref:Uncharacterized protein n=1 Tax=Hydnum rufescens UP504 TaxID=1448309 RepID=A0A9P6DUT1_9AGAM|nr:hypothetical protein BS47DRAFT_1128045 [Hydnum rufescens UP504]